MIYRGRHDEGVVGGRFQVPRFQTKVRNVKVLGWNVIVDVTVEHKNLHKGLFIEHVIRKGGGWYFQSITTLHILVGRPKMSKNGTYMVKDD